VNMEGVQDGVLPSLAGLLYVETPTSEAP